MRISACMIVRDEWLVLGRCLESIRDFVDEIIIFDTGSVDRTVEVAEAYGARVFHSPWRNDFSFHRNQSLKKARGDWILIIDADEVLVRTSPIEFIKDFLKQIQEKGLDTAAIPVQDLRTHPVNGYFYKPEGHRRSGCWEWEAEEYEGSKMNGPRLFRRKANIRYKGIVHNQPQTGDKPAVFLPGLSIKHYGYDPSKLEKKYRRTVALLRKQIADGQPQAWFYLAEYEGMKNRWRECLDACLKYISLKDQLTGKFNGTVYFLALNAAKFLADKQAHEFLLMEGIKHYPGNPDLGFMLAEFGAEKRNWMALFDGSRIHIDGCTILTKDPSAAGNRFYHTVRPAAFCLSIYRLAMASLRIGLNALGDINDRLADPTPNGLSYEMVDGMKKEMTQNLKELGLLPKDDWQGRIPIAATPDFWQFAGDGR